MGVEICLAGAIVGIIIVMMINHKTQSENKELETNLGLAQQRIANISTEKESIADKHLASYSDKESMTKELRGAMEQINGLEGDLGDEREKNRVLISQKKSSETRLGQISEHLIPFLDGCPYNPKDMHFVGNPIDYLVYDFDQGKITFVEIKSGNSKASKRQKTIKNIIKSGRVFYSEMRINTKGVKVTESKNEV